MIRLMTFSGMIAALALAAVLLATLSQTGKVQAADNANCQIVNVHATDDGYGVSGQIQQRVCQ